MPRHLAEANSRQGGEREPDGNAGEAEQSKQGKEEEDMRGEEEKKNGAKRPKGGAYPGGPVWRRKRT